MVSHPGLKGRSSGVKHAFVSSKKRTMAFPPLDVPKRIERDKSGAIGDRWAARARAKRGQD